MLSLPIVFGALTASALVLGLVALWWSVRSTLAGAEEAALDLGEDSSERTALLETKRSLLRALKELEHERQVGKLDEADYRRLSDTYRARAKEVLAQLDQDLGPYLQRARELTGATEVAGRAYRAESKVAKGAEPAAESNEAPEEQVAEPSAEEAEEEEPSEDEPSAPVGKSADAMLASLPEDKRREAEAFLAKLAAEASKSEDAS